MSDIFGEIVERGNKIYILDLWENHFSKPMRYRRAWPTGITADRLPGLIGKTARLTRREPGGIYEVKGRFGESVQIQLAQGGKTKPCDKHRQERNIKAPKGFKEYYDGKWQF